MGPIDVDARHLRDLLRVVVFERDAERPVHEKRSFLRTQRGVHGDRRSRGLESIDEVVHVVLERVHEVVRAGARWKLTDPGKSTECLRHGRTSRLSNTGFLRYGLVSSSVQVGSTS